VKYVLWYDTRTPLKEILTSITCTNIINDNIILHETMDNQIKPSSVRQKERRAEYKRCYEKIQNDPTGNHTQEEIENSVKYQKLLAQYKVQNQKRKHNAAINSRERQRQLRKGREYAKRCRTKKKESENQSTEDTPGELINPESETNNETLTSLSISTDPNVIDNNPPVYNQTLTFLSFSTDQNVIDNNPPVYNETLRFLSFSTDPNLIDDNPSISSDSSSDDNIERSKNVEKESGNLTSTESCNLTHPNVDDNEEGNNNDATTCSRVLLQESPTTSPRKSNRLRNKREIEEEMYDTQDFTQFDYGPLNRPEKDLMIGLQLDLFLWDVKRECRLGTRVLNHGLDIVQQSSTFVVKEATPIKLPEDIEDAFKTMLDVEVNTKRVVFSKLIDKLEQKSKMEGDNLFGQPYYYRRGNRRFLKEGFKKPIYAEFLNPLNRFRIVKQTKRQNLLESFADDSCLNGYVFEIVLAHHFQHKKIACFSCNNKTLLWNGGSDHPWMDVVCTSCNSTYEIKSKKDYETAEKLLRDNKIEGGCFRSFFNLRRKYENSQSTNHYLIVVGREAIKDNQNNDSFHYCTISPIHDVRPLVNPKTFANVQHPKLKSKIMTGSYYKTLKIVGAKFSGPTSESTWKSIASTYLNNLPDSE